MMVIVLLSLAWSNLTDNLHASRASVLAERVERLGDLAPNTDPLEHVRAAMRAETPRVSAELLLSLAWSESRLDPSVHTGRVCGVLQVDPHTLPESRDSDSTCAAWSWDLDAAYAAGAEEIEIELADSRVRGRAANSSQRLWWALAYRACGNAAFVADSACSHAKKSWPAWVLYRAKELGAIR